jgi:hypothetical protein
MSAEGVQAKGSGAKDAEAKPAAKAVKPAAKAKKETK